MNDRFNLEGIDCIWIAPDSVGNVAAFVTGGAGPIPDEIIKSQNILLEDVENKIMELPVTSSANIILHVPRPDDFIDIASRGLYVYDWRDVHRTVASKSGQYEIVATPTLPLKLSSTYGDIRDLLNKFTLKWLDFSKSPSVKIVA